MGQNNRIFASPIYGVYRKERLYFKSVKECAKYFGIAISTTYKAIDYGYTVAKNDTVYYLDYEID